MRKVPLTTPLFLEGFIKCQGEKARSVGQWPLSNSSRDLPKTNGAFLARAETSLLSIKLGLADIGHRDEPYRRSLS